MLYLIAAAFFTFVATALAMRLWDHNVKQRREREHFHQWEGEFAGGYRAP